MFKYSKFFVMTYLFLRKFREIFGFVTEKLIESKGLPNFILIIFEIKNSRGHFSFHLI